MKREASHRSLPIIDVEAVELPGPRAAPAHERTRAPTPGASLSTLQDQCDLLAGQHRSLQQTLAHLGATVPYGDQLASCGAMLERHMQALTRSLAASLASIRESLQHIPTSFQPSED